MSKQCVSCGAELEDGATFCLKCGKPVSLFTPQPEMPNTTSGDMPAADGMIQPGALDNPQQGGFQQQAGYQQQGGFQQQPGGYQQQYQQPQFQQPPYQPNYNSYTQGQYMGLNTEDFSPYRQNERPVSVGQWMLTMILLAIPIVGLIYFIYLAVGSQNTSKSLTNYARATLVWILIIFVISFIAAAVFGVSTSEILKELSSS